MELKAGGARIFIVFFGEMSLQFFIGKGCIHGPAILNCFFLLFLVVPAPAFSRSALLQESGGRALIPVPDPDLSAAERLIREQLEEEQSRLRAKTESQGVSDSARADAFGNMGKLYHTYEFWEAAQACYRNARILMPQDFRWAYLLGRVYESHGEQQKAVEHYQQAARIEPDDLATLLRLAEVQLGLNRPDLADPLFQKAISRDPYPSSAAALVGRGKIALSRGDPDQAIEYLEAAIAMQPQANSIHYPLAMAHRQLGDLEKARAHLQKRGSEQPGFPDPLMEELRELKTGKHFFWSLGTVALADGRFAEAAEAFHKMVAADPAEPIAHMDLGTALLQLGDVSGALTEYQEALRLSSGNARLHYNLGLVYTLQKAHVKALEHYRLAVALDPGLEKAHFNAANLLMRRQDQGKAERHYARVIELNPGDAFARFMQAMALIRLGRHQEARSLLEESHRALPEDVDITHALARLSAASPDSTVRNGPLALQLLQEVLEAQEEVAFEHVETLAMAFAETRQYDRAIEVQQAMIEEVSQDGRTDLVELLEENLSLYRRRQACRQPWRNSDPVFFPVPGDLAPLRSSPETGSP